MQFIVVLALFSSFSLSILAQPQWPTDYHSNIATTASDRTTNSVIWVSGTQNKTRIDIATPAFQITTLVFVFPNGTETVYSAITVSGSTTCRQTVSPIPPFNPNCTAPRDVGPVTINGTRTEEWEVICGTSVGTITTDTYWNGNTPFRVRNSVGTIVSTTDFSHFQAGPIPSSVFNLPSSCTSASSHSLRVALAPEVKETMIRQERLLLFNRL